jgi:hypothetical protein
MAYGFVSRQNVRSTVRGSELQPATTSYLGGVKIDGSTITISDGVIRAEMVTATTTTVGHSRPDNTSITINAGVLSASADVVRNMTAKQTFDGTTTSLAIKLVNAAEKITITSVAVAAAANLVVTDQSIQYHTANSTANWSVNILGNGGVTLDSLMSVGETVTVVHMVTNGATAYYATTVTVDSNASTVKWLSSVPTTGNSNAIDVYTYTVIKRAEATFTVLASQSKYV